MDFLIAAGKAYSPFLLINKVYGEIMRNLIDILDLTCEELDELIALAEDIIKDPKNTLMRLMEKFYPHCF